MSNHRLLLLCCLREIAWLSLNSWSRSAWISTSKIKACKFCRQMLILIPITTKTLTSTILSLSLWESLSLIREVFMTLRSRPLKRSSHPREVRVARKREQVLSTHQTSFNTTSKATPKLTPHRILSRARRLWRLLVLASTPICPSRCRPQLWVNLTHRLKTLSSRGS